MSWFFWIAAAVTAALAVMAPSASASTTSCNAGFVDGHRLSDVGVCGSSTMYVSLTNVGADVGLGGDYVIAAGRFRGWGLTASHPCNGTMPNPCAVGVRPESSIPAYRWGAGGWTSTSISTGRWAYIQRYAGAYEWAYVDGSWYAIRGRYLDAYCTSGTTYSNCTLGVG